MPAGECVIEEARCPNDARGVAFLLLLLATATATTSSAEAAARGLTAAARRRGAGRITDSTAALLRLTSERNARASYERETLAVR